MSIFLPERFIYLIILFHNVSLLRVYTFSNTRTWENIEAVNTDDESAAAMLRTDTADLLKMFERPGTRTHDVRDARDEAAPDIHSVFIGYRSLARARGARSVIDSSRFYI